MSVVVITPPQPIVTLEEAKRQLRVEGDGDNDLLTGLIEAATATIDGPAGWLGRSLGTQTLELRAGAFHRWHGLPYGPIQSVISVKHLDALGAEQSIAATLYFLEAERFVRWTGAWSVPALYPRDDAVRIQYVAGYPTLPASDTQPERWGGPAPIRHAILMMTARFYAARGEDRPANLVEEPIVNDLLAPYRVWSL